MLERNLAELDVLGTEETATLASRDLLERLHADLAPSKFLEYVLDERRHVLADLGGTHLETLTAGRYQFSDDGEFNVIDLAAADQVRTAVSLSGGETFLASWRWPSLSPRSCRARAAGSTHSSWMRVSRASIPSTSTWRWTVSSAWWRRTRTGSSSS